MRTRTKIFLRVAPRRTLPALRTLVAATGISSFGDGLVTAAFPLLALGLTRNALVIGGLAAATRLPWLVVGLPTGALVDRVDRRRLVLLTDLARAVVVGLVAAAVALHVAVLGELYAAAFLLGVGETIVFSASRSIVPLLAKGEAMVRANGQVSAARTATVQFAGPAAGGALFGLVRSVPFLGDAASYLASALLLRSAVAEADPDRTLGRSETRSSLRRDMGSGMAWFVRSPELRTLATIVSSFAFCQAAVLGVLVLYASRVLHLGATGFGVILALAGLGDVAGSLVAARVHSSLGAAATVVAAGAVAAGGYLLLGSTTDRFLAVLALALEAAASSIGNVATLSTRYRVIPAERFGVVNNAFRMVVIGLAPVGAVCGGALASAYGTKTTFVLAGAFQLAALAALARPLWRVSAP